MNKFFCSILIILCVISKSLCQELPPIIPPSPEATSLGKFIDIPVSHYTGLPNISIPIHSIKLGAIEIPISLSYHAKGIRVEEIASRVGIGWALNSGGVISRQIRGSNDEGKGNTIGYLEDDFYTTFFNDTSTGELTRSNVYSKVVLNEIDLFPDIFTFNFMGYSGKFLFDQRTKEPVLQEYSDLKIEPIWSGTTIEAWVVTTPNGYIGYFGESQNGLRFAKDTENVIGQYLYNSNGLTVLGGDGADDPYSSWYLLDIVSPSGQSVNYTYEEETPIYYRRSYDKVVSGSPNSNFSQVQPKQNQIKEIIFDEGKVLFHKKNDERQDLNNAYALEEIEIKDKNNILIKSYQFNYTYTYKVADNNVLPFLATADSHASKRMFLNTITAFDKNKSNSFPPYQFYYNSTILPNRFSNSQDLWGFYNGKNNGAYLTLFSYGSNATISREVDIDKSKAGILTKIDYPTGGSINYEYEHNQATAPDYFRELFFPNTNPVITTPDPGVIVKNPQFWKGTYYESDIFTIGTNVVPGSIKSNIGISPSINCSETQATTNCEYVVQLIGDLVSASLFIGQHDLSSSVIPSGDYRIRVTPRNIGSEDPLDWDTNYFSAILTWEEVTYSEGDTNSEELIFTSGNRIQKIILDDAKGNTISKEYEYNDPSGFSSGKVFSLPLYYHIENPLQNAILFSRKYGARPGSPLTYEQGNHEGYEYVTEYEIGNDGKEGKTEYRFTVFQDGGEFYEFPYTPAIDNEWLRGKPIDITHFKKENDIYSPIKKIYNEYRYGDNSNSALIYSLPPLPVSQNVNYNKTKRIYYLPLMVFFNQDNTYGDSDEYNEYKLYYHTSGTQHLYSTKETNYLDNGLELENETTYFYNYDNHYQLASTELTNSKEETITTVNQYASDYPTDTGMSTDTYNKMLDANMLSSVIKQEKNLDGTLMSTQVNAYKNWDVDNDNVANDLDDILLPEFVKTSKGASALEDRIVYHKYDEQGNPIEVSKTDGTHLVYIWGYNNQYPIAKVENVTYTEIEGLSSFGAGFIIDEGLSTTQENQLRALPNTMVTTYTYDPLIGVTSTTDPKGYTMYYEYDDFNRLKQVKDADGNILSENEYNYKQ